MHLKSDKRIDIIEGDYPLSKEIPNAETQKILRENDKIANKDLKSFESTEELFKEVIK